MKPPCDRPTGHRLKYAAIFGLGPSRYRLHKASYNNFSSETGCRSNDPYRLSISAMSSSDSLTPKTHLQNQTACHSLAIIKLYTLLVKKTIHYNIAHNFAKLTDFQFFSLTDSLVNMQQNCY